MNTKITNNNNNNNKNIIYDKSGSVESAEFKLDPLNKHNYYLTIKFKSFKPHFRWVNEKDEFLIDGDRFKIKFPEALLEDLNLGDESNYTCFINKNCRQTAELAYIKNKDQNLQHFACFSCPLEVWSIKYKDIFQKEHPPNEALAKVVFQNDFSDNTMDITYFFYDKQDLIDWIEWINCIGFPFKSEILEFFTYSSLS